MWSSLFGGTAGLRFAGVGQQAIIFEDMCKAISKYSKQVSNKCHRSTTLPIFNLSSSQMCQSPPQ